MALTVTWVVGTACGGGNHFALTATPSNTYGPQTLQSSVPDLLAPITAEEMATTLRVIARIFYLQCLALGKTPGQTKTAIQAKVLDLTIT